MAGTTANVVIPKLPIVEYLSLFSDLLMNFAATGMTSFISVRLLTELATKLGKLWATMTAPTCPDEPSNKIYPFVNHPQVIIGREDGCTLWLPTGYSETL